MWLASGAWGRYFTQTAEVTLPIADAAAIQLTQEGVSTNAEWTPVMQKFDGVEMVLVPAGCFMMGSTEEEIDAAFNRFRKNLISSKRRKTMKLKTFTLFVLLTMLLGITACSEEATSTPTAIVGEQSPTVTPTPVVTQSEVAPPPTQTEMATEPTATETMPTATVIATEQEPTAAPTEAAPQPTATPTTKPGYFSREELIEDTRQLAHTIESAHPDPYTRGGGRIAFHRRLQRLLNAIPEGGMTKDEFIRLLRPFVAAVGDSHTYLGSDYRVNDHTPGGVPLLFDIVEGYLYVAGVPDEAYTNLIGATLVSVEGVPLAELCERQEQLVGIENEYDVLQHLVEESLWYRPHLEDLLPEWEDVEQITVELQLTSGDIQELVFSTPVRMSSLLTPDSEITLSSASHSLDGSRYLFYDFVDPEREIAYLRATVMEHYREAAEIHHPGSDASTFASTPSATELFRSLVINMKKAGTKTLIVDLRDNEGGTSFMSRILLYFLFGSEDIMARFDELEGQCRAERYSDLSLRQYTIPVNPNDTLSWGIGDYYFPECWTINPDDPQAPQRRHQSLDLAAFREMLAAKFQEQSPTFYAEFVSGEYDSYYRPENVVVLVNPKTFSSAATMARDLYIMGGTLVGTPSGQSHDDNFGESVLFRLAHSSISCYVSHSYFKHIPDNPEMGRVLPVHYPLTYEKLASYDFDPNAEYLYAIELLPELGPIAIATEQEPSAPPTEVTPEPTATASTSSRYYSRDELIEDVRQLAHLLESAHPDPYIRGGGMIAFHHRLQRLLNAIPEGGMTRDEFVRLLRPFIAAVGDAHTDIWDDYRVNDYAPGGVPLRFDIVEQSLYVAGVPHGVDRDLIGAALVSVEGVPLAELCERQTRLQGTENEYNTLLWLSMFSLWYRPFMEDLLPEWKDTSSVSVELQLPGGEVQELVFDLPQRISRLHTSETQITLPSTDNSGFLYDLLDGEGKTAYLRVDHMNYYREDLEVSAAVGARESTEQERAGIPSVTETFRNMVVDMEKAGTDTLIIDLRDNGGGDSLMADILIYFLYGKQTLTAVQTHPFAAGGGRGERFSNLYFQSRSNVTLESINQDRAVPLIEGDYDFSWDFTGDVERFQELPESEASAFYQEWFQRTSTFYAEYESGAYAGYYRPKGVVVLVTPWTFSSGFTLARYLYLAGATLVGAPSAQASNCFGNALNWRLNHTGIRGVVSFSYYIEFPDDPEVGRVLPVHYPLTYEKLASYDFDPNAEYLYALELLPELGE